MVARFTTNASKTRQEAGGRMSRRVARSIGAVLTVVAAQTTFDTNGDSLGLTWVL